MQDAASKYERALSMESAAREMMELTEQGYAAKKARRSMAWPEMLNHATNKVCSTLKFYNFSLAPFIISSILLLPPSL